MLRTKFSIAYIIIVSLSSAECAAHRQKQNTTVDLENPCDIEISSVPPDYRKLGMVNSRISEIKCKEFMWHMEYREAVHDRDDKCIVHKYGPGIKPLIGGIITNSGEFPHMAAIGWRSTTGRWTYKCGGSLISNKFILTAAHCARIADRDTTVLDLVPRIARLGSLNLYDIRLGYDYINNITRMYVHPQYKYPITYFDIALMELEKPVVFTKSVQPACLWTKFNTSLLGTKAILTGWGVVDKRILETSHVLLKGNVEILDSKECDKLLHCSGKWCGMQDNQLCAGDLSGGVDSCQGDSGGPLQVKIPLPITTQGTLSYVIGITSFGKGCALTNTPGVYARVSAVLDWIESIVWPKNN